MHRVLHRSKKFKRLRKAHRESEEFDGSGKGGRTAEEKIKPSLFGEVDDDEEDEEVDELDDFIVDEHEPHSRHKKNKLRHASGASFSALREAQEIFGDVSKRLQLRKQQGFNSNECRERRLGDDREVEEEEIVHVDIPERMQPVTIINHIDEESTWIYNQIANGASFLQGVTINADHINRFLQFHLVQMFDVPYIATYLRNECLSLFKDPGQLESDYDNQDNDDQLPKMTWHKVVSAVQGLHKKWLLFHKRKTTLRSYYLKRCDGASTHISDKTRFDLNKSILDSIIKSLDAAESEQDIDDVHAKFKLHFPLGEVGDNEGQFKKPQRMSEFSNRNKAGVREVASKFGRSAEQLGLHLLQSEMGDALEDAKEAPEEMASKFTSEMFGTPQDVLKGARNMAAVEISLEPYVRKHFRAAYMEDTVVSTIPTFHGNTIIDSFHQLCGLQWLHKKPVRMFKDAQWLLIENGEKNKLLEVTFELPKEHMIKLLSEFVLHYYNYGVSESAPLWNKQRELILEDAFFMHLLPSMEKEARSLLTSRAKRWLLWQYGQVLWNKVSVGPYQRKGNDRSSDDEASPRVMACCLGSGKPATTFVMLDSAGEVLGVLNTRSLTLCPRNVDDEKIKKDNRQQVQKFMMDHQPNVVVLGAVNVSCTRLKQDISEIISKMARENPREVGHDMAELNIVYGDESLPSLYENSLISLDQLPTQPGIVRKAVALGRFLQNPLAMAATLCGSEREILLWNFNSLEMYLTPDEKYAMVETVMVDVANQVGFDVNLAICHEWLFAPLQFISGLGPRKAASLRRSLVRAGVMNSTEDLVTIHGVGKKVFDNAVEFMRVRQSGLIKSINMESYTVDPTCIRNNRYLDPYYREDKVILQIYQEKARREKELAQEPFTRRLCWHPYFKNITADEAMENLADKDPGESIIRPSSVLQDLILTLKVYNGVYAHVTIGQEHENTQLFSSIGKTLKIKGDTFEDLDEIFSRYVDPFVVHLKSMLSYEKFRGGTKAEVDELLKIEKRRNPTSIVYLFGVSHEHPGTFILTYIKSTNPQHELVSLSPKGFKFRYILFKDIHSLVAYFEISMRSGTFENEGGGWRGGQSSDRDRSSGRNDYGNGRVGGGRAWGRGGHGRVVSRPYGHDWGSFAGNRPQNSLAWEGFSSGSGGGGSSSWGGGRGVTWGSENAGRYSLGWGGGGVSGGAADGWKPWEGFVTRRQSRTVDGFAVEKVCER